MKNVQVAILIGSDSDLAVMSEAAKILDEFGITYQISVLSAHRTPRETINFAKEAKKRGFMVIIAGAGGSAHLAGVVAAHTTLPVIGVPVKSKAMEGLDSLLSTVQMPPGVPVATVGIDSAKNAGLLAASIIATYDKKIAQKLEKFKKEQKDKVLKKNSRLYKIGWRKYLQDQRKSATKSA